MRQLTLRRLAGVFAICKLGPDEEIPEWLNVASFTSISRTEDELSIVCPDESVPEDIKCERGWRCIQIAGPLKFSELGVLASVINPLKEVGISIFAISTFDTDYVFVKSDDFDNAVEALEQAGHIFLR